MSQYVRYPFPTGAAAALRAQIVTPAVAGAAFRSVTATDSLGTTDSATCSALLLARTAADSLGTTDSAPRSALSRARTASDTLGTTDSTTRSALNLARTASDSLGTTDTATRSSLTRSRTAADSLGTTDTAARSALLRARTAADSLGTSDTATRSAFSRARTGSDTLGTTDAATKVTSGHTVLTFDADPDHFAQFAWSDVDFTGPLSVCFITHRTNPGDETDKRMLVLWDNDANDFVWEVEHSGGPVGGGEFSSFVTGADGGQTGLGDAQVAPLTIGDWDKSWEIWFTWDGTYDFSDADRQAGTWHWRNLTDDPTTWHHVVSQQSASFARTLLPLIPNGELFIGGNPNDALSAYSGGIGFYGLWAADLSAHLNTDPLHTHVSELQAINPTAMRAGAQLLSTDPAQIVDLAGAGVVCDTITASLGVTIPEFTFDGAAPSGAVIRTAADTLGTTDTATRAALSRARTASDTLGTSDSATRSALARSRTATDTLGTSDTATRSALSRARTATDSLGTSDAATRTVTVARTAADSLGTSDTATRSALTRARTASDSLSTTDAAARSALVRQRTAADTLGTTDSAASTLIGGNTRTASDNLGTTDAANRSALLRSRVSSDSLGTTDSTVRATIRYCAAADTLGTTDAASRLTIRVRTASDTLGTSETVLRAALSRVRSATDALNTSDTASSSGAPAVPPSGVAGLASPGQVTGDVQPSARMGRVSPVEMAGV